eukprot:gene8197-9075_t
MDGELEDIKLDFKSNELQFKEDQYNELLLSTDICDIECLGWPFLPGCQKGSCPCEAYLQKERKIEQTNIHCCDVNRGFQVKLNDHRLKSKQEPDVVIKKKYPSLHVDEFLLELLNTGGYEAYIHWTVKERQEFKITRPQRIAALWGDRKSRKMMSDDKLLRSLRYAIKKRKIEKTDSQNLLFRFLND